LWLALRHGERNTRFETRWAAAVGVLSVNS